MAKKWISVEAVVCVMSADGGRGRRGGVGVVGERGKGKGGGVSVLLFGGVGGKRDVVPSHRSVR